MPGTFEFDKRGYFVKESCGEVVIVIIRENGTDGDVRVTCATREKTAVDGKDYQGGTFDILFRTGETTKLLRIPIIDDMSATEKEEVFEVEIVSVDCEGAVIGAKKSTTVNIANDENFAQLLDNMMDLTNSQLDSLSLYRSSWMDQLKVSFKLTAKLKEIKVLSHRVSICQI